LAETAEISRRKAERAINAFRISFVSLQERVFTNEPGKASKASDLSLERFLAATDLSSEARLGIAHELDSALHGIELLMERVRSVTYGKLAVRDAEIFAQYYGLDGTGRRTFDRVAVMHDVTRERVRQIIKKIWAALHRNGDEMDHNGLIAEMKRIGLLRELVEHVTSA
jgi:DNA-directed RNA polymerase sigma subunit (sigma70/sigma32)